MDPHLRRRKDDGWKALFFPYLLAALTGVAGSWITLSVHVMRDYPTISDVKELVAAATKNDHERQDEIIRQHGVIEQYVAFGNDKLRVLETKVDALQQKINEVSHKVDLKPVWFHFVQSKPKKPGAP